MRTLKDYTLDEWQYFRQDMEGMWRGENPITSFMVGMFLSTFLAFVTITVIYLTAIGLIQRRDLKRAWR